MRTPKKYSNLLSSIRPGFIIAVTIVIALIMVFSAYFELTQSKKEIYNLMNRNALSLIESISMSSVNTVLSNDEVENLIAQRLLTTGRMVAHLDSLKHIKNRDLKLYAVESGVFRINVFDRVGNKIAGSFTPDSSHKMMESKHSPKDFIAPILNGEKQEIVIGFKEARYEEGSRFAVAVKRAKNRKGAIVVNVDASYILAFKKKIGFGKMIQDIGSNSGIEYIILQDNEGVISASKQVKDVSSIAHDDFLTNALGKDSVFSRSTVFGDKEVFEVVKPLIVEGEKIGLFRVGLSMDEMNALENRMIRRGITLSIILFIIAVISISAISVNQNLKTVSGKYEKIQNYTGDVLENLADGVITTDKNGMITIINTSACRILGVDGKAVTGKYLFDITGSSFSELRDSLNSKKAVEVSSLTFLKTGSENLILSAGTTFTFDKNGDIDSFTVVLRNITQVRKMEEQVKQKEKMTAMGELASGVAHEIRNPLNAISMIAQRYKKEFIPKKNTKDYTSLTNVLLNETKRVNNIIRQFLEFARPPKLNRTEIQSDKFIDELRAVFESESQSKGVSFDTKCPVSETLIIDGELMKQALLNILQNALDATPKGGSIKLEYLSEKFNSKFVIQDSGNGIPKEILNKIFNLYFTTKTKGTGLGLSLVQMIVSQHDGTIEVESEEGKGTKFEINLPKS